MTQELLSDRELDIRVETRHMGNLIELVQTRGRLTQFEQDFIHREIESTLSRLDKYNLDHDLPVMKKIKFLQDLITGVKLL